MRWNPARQAARATPDRLHDCAQVQVAGASGQVVVAAGLVGTQRVEFAIAGDQRGERDRRKLGPCVAIERAFAQLAQQRQRHGRTLKDSQDHEVCVPAGQ
jgi:hypothetical protein